jgi:hypothetical protein
MANGLTLVNGGLDPLTGYSSGPASFDERFPFRLAGDSAMDAWRSGLPSLPDLGGSATKGADTIANAAKSAGITGGTITPSATTGNPSVATGASVANNWFVRGTVVVLGFVFVAVGLSQFNAGQRVVREALRRT